jgi:hypothetical protein
MDSYTEQQIEQIRVNAEEAKRRIDDDAANQIRQLTEQQAQKTAEEIRMRGEQEARKIGN